MVELQHRIEVFLFQGTITPCAMSAAAASTVLSFTVGKTMLPQFKQQIVLEVVVLPMWFLPAFALDMRSSGSSKASAMRAL